MQALLTLANHQIQSNESYVIQVHDNLKQQNLAFSTHNYPAEQPLATASMANAWILQCISMTLALPLHWPYPESQISANPQTMGKFMLGYKHEKSGSNILTNLHINLDYHQKRSMISSHGPRPPESHNHNWPRLSTATSGDLPQTMTYPKNSQFFLIPALRLSIVQYISNNIISTIWRHTMNKNISTTQSKTNQRHHLNHSLKK